jgi:hypothetical protein
MPWPGNLRVVAMAFRLRPQDRLTFEQLADLAKNVRALFTNRNICIKPLSTLGRLLQHVDSIAAQWASGLGQDVTAMIDAITAMRVTEAILSAQGECMADTCYRRIAKKDVDLFSPEPSQGKDALWELQLLQILKSRGMNATLAEPDIMATVGSFEIPVACKKIYSEKNLENQLRSAGTQLAKFNAGGIAALNLDAQVPKDHLIVSTSSVSASSTLVKVAYDFLGKHQTLIRRLISDGKFDAVLVSVSCPMDNRMLRPRFNVGTETLLWCPPDVCSIAGQARVEAFRNIMSLSMLGQID